MHNFKVAVAQIPSVNGDANKNIESHLKAIDVAIEHQASIVIFPELSLTGYEPELASDLAFVIDDDRLHTFVSTASKNNIWIVVGAPVKFGSEIHIGSIIFSPDGAVSTYSKMNLHPGEERFFSVGKEPRVLEIDNHRVALAICADTNNPLHAQVYAKDRATVYAAGVLITDGGYALDTEKLQSYAIEHDMLVVMANHNKPTGGWQPIGKSAAWDKNGRLSAASEDKDSIIISQQNNGTWESRVIEM
ncbi:MULTISPECIES: carbon-nitrogen hydrolase family protein [unclassified Endozoicomonas]|uniref:carbon-nitrogen hydrolase family protein n=1 Tax=unclassified Endozoicomonas TaxID=2644528 RepID=UPI003BB809BE